CEQIFNNEEWEIISSPESPAFPYGSFETFYEKVEEEAQGIKEKGKVFVRFVVDTLGNVHCAQVLKSDNELLNSKAVGLIERTKVFPAVQRGKKVVSTMILPITFGAEPPSKNRKKCKN